MYNKQIQRDDWLIGVYNKQIQRDDWLIGVYNKEIQIDGCPNSYISLGDVCPCNISFI